MSKQSETLEMARKFLESKAAHGQAVSQPTPETPTTSGAISSAVSTDPPELICLLGKPGSGKTETALSLLEVPGVDRVVAMDVDKKMARMASAQRYIKDGRLLILNINSPLIAGSMVKRAGTGMNIASGKKGGAGFYTIAAPATEPKGYLEIMEHMDRAEEVIARFNAQAWITDSTTRVYEHMHRLIQFMTKKGTLEESAWNIALMDGEEFVHAHMALPVRYVILTAHTRGVYDEGTGALVGTEIEVQGSMRSKFLGYFNEAYFLDPTAAGVYRMATKLTNFTPARTSRRLNKYEPADLRVVLDNDYREGWYKNNPALA